MAGDTVKLSILCNPPRGFHGNINFMIGLGDDLVGEGHANETVTIDVPMGENAILVLVRNEGINSMQGTTNLVADRDMSLRIRYGILNRTATLVLNE